VSCYHKNIFSSLEAEIDEELESLQYQISTLSIHFAIRRNNIELTRRFLFGEFHQLKMYTKSKANRLLGARRNKIENRAGKNFD
jgi:hypothetical protein